MIHLGEIKPKADGVTFGNEANNAVGLWPGVAAMVVASFVSFFAKPDVITSALSRIDG
jgi:hypothetical protein